MASGMTLLRLSGSRVEIRKTSFAFPASAPGSAGYHTSTLRPSRSSVVTPGTYGPAFSYAGAAPAASSPVADPVVVPVDPDPRSFDPFDPHAPASSASES